MFISKGERLLAALGITGAAVVLWGVALCQLFGTADAGYCFFFTCQLVALVAYAGSQALLPEGARDE